MAKPQIACHELVFRDQGQKDPASMYDAIARAGFKGVEGGVKGDARTHRAELERRGLSHVASHIFTDSLEKDLESLIAAHKVTGAPFLCVSGYDYRTGREYREVGERLQKAGARCAREGIRLLYHNHDWEVVHDLFGLQNLLAATDPEAVGLCLDTHWLARGGQDPVAVLREYRDRTAYVHFKDYIAGKPGATWTELGQGTLDWKAILAEVETWSIPWVAVEQDTTTLRPETSIQVSRDGLRAHGW